MIALEQWKSFLKVTKLTTGSFEIILNSFLILLIIFRSPKHLGAYKYLMIYISLVEIVYSILEMITEPHVFTHGPTLTILRYFKYSRIRRTQGFYLIVVYGGTFGQALALFGVHFIYRYGAVDNVFRKKYLGERKLFILFLIPLIYAVWWSSIVFFFFRPSTESDEYLRIPLLQKYDTKVEDISYIIVKFYELNENGYLEPVWSTFFGMSCTWVMLSTSFSCVFYFGIKCYTQTTKVLKKSRMSSYYARSIQQQLFQALVMQTLIPVILVYLPVGITHYFPMVNMEIGLYASVLIATISIYPALDPLPTMFIVENYRKTIMCKKLHGYLNIGNLRGIVFINAPPITVHRQV
ncbi:Protein CBG06393 [Caenorhabditis briggsae]|uniref:Serpentine receptor class r-10 n=1 Tax=Caenorhabditis briggsae TaxID=6238 RepID=A8X247_CAEBR|nr:Protein CBG06393 [Caenorhabditis briggsae]CAP26707.1 Protein CBG06393 [Caenorhabditis briggsae]